MTASSLVFLDLASYTTGEFMVGAGKIAGSFSDMNQVIYTYDNLIHSNDAQES